MTPTSAGLAPRRLKEKYLQVRQSGRLGGSDSLAELRNLAADCFDAGAGRYRVVAFVLACMFEKLAEDEEGRPVTIDEAQDLFAIFDQPVIRAIDFLSQNEPESACLDILVSLADAWKRDADRARAD